MLFGVVTYPVRKLRVAFHLSPLSFVVFVQGFNETITIQQNMKVIFQLHKMYVCMYCITYAISSSGLHFFLFFAEDLSAPSKLILFVEPGAACTGADASDFWFLCITEQTAQQIKNTFVLILDHTYIGT